MWHEVNTKRRTQKNFLNINFAPIKQQQMFQVRLHNLRLKITHCCMEMVRLFSSSSSPVQFWFEEYSTCVFGSTKLNISYYLQQWNVKCTLVISMNDDCTCHNSCESACKMNSVLIFIKIYRSVCVLKKNFSTLCPLFSVAFWLYVALLFCLRYHPWTWTYPNETFYWTS